MVSEHKTVQNVATFRLAGKKKIWSSKLVSELLHTCEAMARIQDSFCLHSVLCAVHACEGVLVHLLQGCSLEL